VQSQNVPLFHKLRWTSIGALSIHGRPHTEMRADLGFYPPCHDAVSGFVSRGRSAA
jgi:hypothetical protein